VIGAHGVERDDLICRAARRFLRPAGADVLKHECSHGLRDAESGIAPPVATFRRPVGADSIMIVAVCGDG
jgi:hypothetical protein